MSWPKERGRRCRRPRAATPIWCWCMTRKRSRNSSRQATASIAGRSAWNESSWSAPAPTPAHIAGGRDAVAALRATPPRLPFVSRGDRSGTDALEDRLWHLAAIDSARAGGGPRYRDIGGGMGAALNTARAMDAYTISDRGTWLSFGSKGELAALVEGDPRLANRYDVILLNPAKHPAPKQALARRFAEWLSSRRGQAAIGAYEVNGEQLFHPSAAAPR